MGNPTQKSFGFDKIHFLSLIIILCVLEILRPVSYTINLKFKRGILPDSLKIAKVKRYPDYKALVPHAMTTDPYQFFLH